MELQVGMIASTETYKDGFEIYERVSLEQLADSYKPTI